jgi:hypothetical protein
MAAIAADPAALASFNLTMYNHVSGKYLHAVTKDLTKLYQKKACVGFQARSKPC